MPKRVQFNLRLKPHELAELRALAAEKHLTVSEFVRVFTLTKKGTMQGLDDLAEEVREQQEQEKLGQRQLRIRDT